MKRLLPVLAVLLAAGPAMAQSINIDLGDNGSLTGRVVQMLALITVLSIAPSNLVVVTSFTRIVVVLSLLRSALGINTSPPNSVLISLALFLSFFVMQPTLEKAYTDGIQPLIEERIDERVAFERAAQPFHNLMMKHTRLKDIQPFADMAKVAAVANPADLPYRVLVPAFMIGELKRAFEIGFLIFLPVLVIDMVVSSILMSMGVMMLSPVTISLPFKLIFFVLVDGWALLAGSLVQSFGTS